MARRLAATQQTGVRFSASPPGEYSRVVLNPCLISTGRRFNSSCSHHHSPCGEVASRLTLNQQFCVRFAARRPLTYGETGITPDSESGIRGSNPCRSTTEDKLDRRASPASKTGGTLTGLRIETAVFRHKQTEAQPIRDRHRLESGWPDRVGFESSRFRQSLHT